MLEGNGGACLRVIQEADSRGADPRQFQGECLEYLRTLLLVQNGAAADLPLADDERRQAESHAREFPSHLLLAALHRFSEARPSVDRSLPSLPLELAAVETALDMADRRGGDRPPALLAGADRPPATHRLEPVSQPSLVASTSTSTLATIEADPAAPLEARAGVAVAFPPISPGSTAPLEENRTAATPSPAASPAALTATVTLDEVRAVWAAIVAAVGRQDRTAAALLKDCRPIGAKGREVHLGFFSEFHRHRASEKARIAIIAGAIGDALGGPIMLVCTVVNPTPDEDSSRPRSKTDQASSDPLVRHAMDTFGARIAGVKSGGGE